MTTSLGATIFKSAICRTNLFPRPNPTLFFFPGLNNCNPILDNNSDALREASKVLRANHAVILQEYYSLKKAGFKNDYNSGDHKLHTGSWNWYSYVMKGQRQASFAAHCPRTTEVLESIQSQPNGNGLMLGTPFSFAFFSQLGGKSSIGAHFGPCNLRIRCHFPLIVPDEQKPSSKGELDTSSSSSRRSSDSNDDDVEPACGMEVGGQMVRWRTGEPLFFDDSYEHRVWNHSEAERVVLLFDMWHPDLKPAEIQSVGEMFEYAAQQGWLGAKAGSAAAGAGNGAPGN